MEDTRPFATDEDDTRTTCFCCPAQPALELQALRRIPLRKATPKCADIRAFVAIICFYILSFVMMEYYLVGVITTLEKRFGFSSSKSGMLMSVKEVAFMCVVAVMTHFANNVHRPRFLTIMGILGAAGGYIFVLPHVIYGSADFGIEANMSSASSKLLCMRPGENGGSWRGNNTNRCSEHMNDGAYAMFVVGSILIGLGVAPLTALTVTYVDDACGVRRTSLFLGFMYMMRPFGPVFAFIAGSIFTSVHETLHDPGFGTDDHRWVGAWWIGYLVLPSLLLAISLLLPLFPASIPRDPVKDSDTVDGRTANVIPGGTPPVPSQGMASIKELFVSVWCLLRNPVYMTLQLGGCMSAFVISGLFPFIPKYLEVQFFLSASKANLLTGLTAALLAGCGVFLGGYVASRYRWTAKQCALFILLVDLIFTLTTLLLLAVKCPDRNLAPFSETNGTCQSECGCSQTAFHPVCGQEDRSYITPCHAGCQVTHDNKTWGQCGCGGNHTVATDGLCIPVCRALVPFLILMGLGATVLMSASVPGYQINLRCVEEKHRSLGLGFGGMLASFVSFVPGPMVYGSLIDTTCLLWRQTCGERGDCLLYDKDRFGNNIFAITAAFKLGAGVFYFAMWLLLRRQDAAKVNIDALTLGSDPNIDVTRSSGHPVVLPT